MRVHLLIFAVFIFVNPALYSQPDIQNVVQQLQSPDNETRLRAIEQASKLGSAIIPHLPTLLTHTDWRVQRAAQIVLENIAAHSTTLKGKERLSVVNALLTFTKPNQPVQVRKAALQSLAICGTDDAVPALAKLLEDEQVREDSLAALKQIGTPVAAKAIANAALTARGNWLNSLLSTLGEMRQPEGVPVLLNAFKKGDIETKRVAVNALGLIGDTRAIPIIIEAVQKGFPSAYDALTRTGEALLAKKQLSEAANAFEQAFRLARNEHEKCAALIGLGKVGSAKSLPILVDALDDPDLKVSSAAKEALVTYRHPDTARGFQQMFRRANPKEKVGLLQVIVARKEPIAVKLLQESSASNNEELRLAALELMGQIDDFSLEQTLWAEIIKGSRKSKTVALNSYLNLAQIRAKKGKVELARTMFEQGLRVAEDIGASELQSKALLGLAMVGSEKSLPVIDRYLNLPQPPPEAFAAAVAIANNLSDLGKKEDAVALLKRLLSLRPPRPLGLQAAQILTRLGEDPSAMPKQAGFLVRWWLLGPLPNPDNRAFERVFIDETSIEPLRTETVRIDNRLLRWREVRVSDPQGVVDLTQIFRQTEWVACYAYASFIVDSDMDAELRIGSDDSVKVWFNGELVHQFGGMRGLSIDQDRIRVRLQKGVNHLLLKVTQGGGGWEFCVRLVDLQGKPIAYSEP